MTEAPDFSRLVAQDQYRIVREDTEKTQLHIAAAQKEYDDNLAVIEQLEISDQFRRAADSICGITGKKADVAISQRPYLEFNELSSKIPVVGGSPNCEVTLSWEPSGSSGVVCSIAVIVAKGDLIIKSARPGFSEQWSEEKLNKQIDQSMLNQALFRAYQCPHWE